VTDRHSGYVVTLAADVRDDDAQAIITALRMVRGVISVEPVIADIQSLIAESRRDLEWREALRAMVQGMRGHD
jgi:hypothetical protein